MSKVWVVMRRDYEYNDETYNANEGGNNIIAFTTELDAQIDADERNINTFRKEGGYMYLGYDAGDNFNETDDLVNFLETLGDTENEDRSYSYDDLGDYYRFEEIMDYLKNATDDEIMVFVNALVNPEYYVEAVEVTR